MNVYRVSADLAYGRLPIVEEPGLVRFWRETAGRPEAASFEPGEQRRLPQRARQ